jgi:murein DD-endopeptidase MepM/ murein hydrolase activator NlpD
MSGVIPPTTTSNIGFDFGATNFSYYPDVVWRGQLYQNFHGGIDYWGPLGYPIWSCANGTVLHAGFGVPYIGSQGGFGVVINHGPDMKSIYGHMEGVSVAPGQQVVGGQNIGTMGASGIANGVNHLHFEIRVNHPIYGADDYENPNALFEGGSAALTYGVDTYDIPWIEPISGTTITLARCIRQADGSYALPTGATSVRTVYYDRVKVSTSGYSVQTRSGSLYIVPSTALDVTIEVRADYVT